MAKTSPGDHTGRQKQKLIREAQDAQSESAKKVAMATAAEQDRRKTEVVDYTAKKSAPPVDTGPKDLTVEDDEDATIARIVAGTAEPESGTVGEPEDLTAPKAPKAPAVPAEPVKVEKSKVLIRSKYDLPQVTVGKGTLYNFEEGQRYYVPPNVAKHLASKDLIDVLG